MRVLFQKSFDIREGELFRALAMQLNIFLIITTLLIIKPTSNSLFLSAYGVESLPYAYILVAVIAGMITFIYARIVHHIQFLYVNMGTLFSSVIFLLFFGIALRTGFYKEWIMYLFYIWVSIFAVLTTSQFWLLANKVFNIREIKRLVGFIGSGAIAGGIFGGYLTSFLIRHTSSVNLPFVAAFTIALCIPLTIIIYLKGKRKLSVADNNVPTTATKSHAHPLQLILQSKHLSLMACLVAIGNIVAKLVDYQFSDMASSAIADPEQLTAFFGFWFSTFNVVALVIQLLGTRYILQHLGISASLLLLPLGIGLAVLCLIFAPELLAVAIAMKMADGSLKQSVNKSAMELLIMPIDAEIKNQTKTFIDVFVDSIAAGFSGLVLIFVVKGLALHGVSISILILGFTGCWIYLVSHVRRAYLYSFKMKIINGVKGFRPKTKKLRGKWRADKVVNVMKRAYIRIPSKRKKVTFKIYREITRVEQSLAAVALQTTLLERDRSEVAMARKRLLNLLQDQLIKQTDYILYLLGLCYASENIRVVKKGLKSTKIPLRNTALEFLDNLLENDLKKLLIPLLDVILVSNNRTNIRQFVLDIPTEYNCYHQLLSESNNLRIKISTLHLIKVLHENSYQELIVDCLYADDPELSLTAKNMLPEHGNLKMLA